MKEFKINANKDKSKNIRLKANRNLEFLDKRTISNGFFQDSINTIPLPQALF
jgi:hypothetical protein